jgi:hypothetical protein
METSSKLQKSNAWNPLFPGKRFGHWTVVAFVITPPVITRVCRLRVFFSWSASALLIPDEQIASPLPVPVF